MYKIFQENKALIFPKIEDSFSILDATPQESDRYDAELLCEFLPEWLDDRDPSDTYIHEVGANAVASALNDTFRMAPAAGGIVVVDGKFISIVRHGIPDLPKGHIEKVRHPKPPPCAKLRKRLALPTYKLSRHCHPHGIAIWSMKCGR